MTLSAKINGLPCELEIPDNALAALVAPKQFSLQQAADYLGRSKQTILNRKIPKNKNGKYAIETLNEWAK